MKYEKASAEVVLFDNSDVITTSSQTDAMGKDNWDQGKIDEEFGCNGTTSHVVKNF